MDEIRNQLIELSNLFKVSEVDGTEKPEIGHFVFRGAPGTGKTTVARVMAKILHQLRILPRNYVEETSGAILSYSWWWKVDEYHTLLNFPCLRLEKVKITILLIFACFPLGLKLTGDFVGQTKTKVAEALNKARGGVLFIDEAYGLAKSQYGQEAIDTLVC